MTEAPNAVFEKAGELFGKKYFGIPFPLILIGVGGTAFIVRRMIKGNEEAKDVDSYTPEGEGYAMDVSGNKFASAYTGQAGGVPFGSGSLTNALASGNTPATPATEINNEGWLRRATEKLNLLGQWNVTEIQTALQSYISGRKLDQRQAAIVQQAVKVEGIAPVNISPGTTETPAFRRLIRPAGQAGIFAEYTNGDVFWITDPNSLRSLQASLQAEGKPISATALPLTDPIWQNADVVKTKSKAYLAAEAQARKDGPGQFSSSRLFS